MAWELGSGNRSDYDFHIQEAWFAPDAQYQDGNTTLFQIRGVDEDGEEVHEMWNVGKDWMSPDGGKTVVSNRFAKAKIPANSMFGKFIEACLEIPGFADVLEKRGQPYEAAVWVGILVHLNEKEVSFGSNLNPVIKNFPVSYTIEGGGSPAASARRPATPKPAAATTTAKPDLKAMAEAAKAQAAAASQLNGTGDLVTQLTHLAKSSADFQTFIDGATELDGLTDDDELLTLVLDPADGGFYNLNHA